MIEIMKEGDKLSKTASKNLRPEDINIAHLIRQRVEQIRRYEMLRDNKELLEQVHILAKPRTLAVDRWSCLELLRCFSNHLDILRYCYSGRSDEGHGCISCSESWCF